MTTDQLLHVARPRECNTQQTPPLHATARATSAQQTTLRALSGAVLARNRPCNSHATTVEKACNNTPLLRPSFVASNLDRPTTGNAELDGLIDIVGRHYDTPEDEYQLIRETAAGAIQGALLSFRAMATRHLLFSDEPIPDDRRLCRDCSNLARSGQCLAAQRGTIDAHRGYQPVKNVLHRCNGFKVEA